MYEFSRSKAFHFVLVLVFFVYVQRYDDDDADADDGAMTISRICLRERGVKKRERERAKDIK